MNMRKIIFSVSVVTASVMLMSNSSCNNADKKNNSRSKVDSIAAAGEKAKKEYEQAQANEEKQKTGEGFIKATVVDNTGLDGCSFMLLLESGQKLMPLNLAKEFMKDNMKVWVKYSPAKGAMTVCMAGEAVNVAVIEERK